MYPSLSFASKFSVTLALCGALFGVGGANLYANAVTPVSPLERPPVATVTSTSQADAPILLAHHGGEMSGAVSLGAVSTQTSVMTVKGHASHSSTASDSLWGNLLIAMACQRDPEVQKYVKRLGRVNTATLLSVVGISALGLAQSINALDNAHGAQAVDIVDHGDGGHVHVQADSKTPATLGIVSTSASLATIGIKSILDRHYSHRLAQRQQVIKDNVETLLNHLDAGGNIAEIEQPLTRLVGERATREFIQLWTASHT